jgi:hypothetical protein
LMMNIASTILLAIRLATSIMLKSTCAGRSRTKSIFYTMDI